MAIYYATTKPISRSSGRTSTASSAYRAGVELTDERTGLTHDYSKRGGVVMSHIFLVNEENKIKRLDRTELWNKAETAEKRKDARTAREWVVAIPNELVPNDPEKQKDIRTNKGAQTAVIFAKELSKRYGVAVDLAIHSPDKQGDNRNWHAHIMTTTRQAKLDKSGKVELGEKTTLELSNTKRKTLGLDSTAKEIKGLRELWAKCANQELKAEGLEERIDHRSYAERGIDQKPTIKLGVQATAMERKGIATNKGDINRGIQADNLEIKGLKLEIIRLRQEKKPVRELPIETVEQTERRTQIAATKAMVAEVYKNHPDKLEKAMKAIEDKTPDIMSGKIKLPPTEVKQQAERGAVKTPAPSQDKGMER